MMTSDLHNIETAVEFYDDRYEEGYMEEWDDSKKKKVMEIIVSLNLPDVGNALDYGCGNGVFTNFIKKCLPNWKVFGVEISPTAVKNASKKFPECAFFTSESAAVYFHQFDFLFSHHVIEHVQDINDTVSQIDEYLKPVSSQLHILPCGNEGSYEYDICLLHKDGIEKDKDNRFFFEEPGHLRRLTSKELIEAMKHIGFVVKNEFFANQYYGAINWITKSSPRFVKKLTDTANAKDEASKAKLHKLRKYLLALTYRQFPYSKYWMIQSKWSKKTADHLKMAILFIPAVISKKAYDKLNNLADDEWKNRKDQPNGSEMYLHFKRT